MNQLIKKTDNSLNYLWLFLLAVIWGSAFVAIKELIQFVPPFFGAMLRVGAALVFITIIFSYLKKDLSVPFDLRWRIWLTGLFSQGLPFAFLFYGEQYISAGLAGILNGTVPLWTFVFSLLSPRTRNFSLLKCVGLFIGFLGIYIIFSPFLHIKNESSSLVGTLSLLGMAISYSIGNLLNHYRLKGQTRLDFYANIYHQHWASFFFLALLTLAFERWPSLGLLLHTPMIWVTSLYMGLFTTALAWIIYYHLIREWDAVRASIVMYIVPIMALIWDFLFFHHVLKSTEGEGIVTILLGAYLIWR